MTLKMKVMFGYSINFRIKDEMFKEVLYKVREIKNEFNKKFSSISKLLPSTYMYIDIYYNRFPIIWLNITEMSKDEKMYEVCKKIYEIIFERIVKTISYSGRNLYYKEDIFSFISIDVDFKSSSYSFFEDIIYVYISGNRENTYFKSVEGLFKGIDISDREMNILKEIYDISRRIIERYVKK